MTRKIRLSLFLIITCCCATHAQSREVRKGDRFFESYNYRSAAASYESALIKEPTNKEVVQRLAECYLKLNDPGSAERWLLKVCSNPDADPGKVKLYAQVLASNGKYDKSIEQYQKYVSMSADAGAATILSGLRKINQFYEDSVFTRIIPFAMNSPQADFSPVYYKDGIVFCSARKLQRKQPKSPWDDSPFIDLYFASLKSGSIEPFGKSINSSLHEGPASFSSSGDTIYFTRNATLKQKAGKDNVVRLMLYYAVKSSNGWQREVALPFNNNDYSIGHPAVGQKGRLYFVSDMPGGFGGTDIYYSDLHDGRWSKPTNAGSAVNTSANEMFPFVDSEGNLYFSSTGHPGLGGLDLFKYSLNGGIDAPENLGYPFNSSKDDFGFIIADGQGFFSSNRGSGHLDDNIYSFVTDKKRSLSVKATNRSQVLQDYSVTVTRNGISMDTVSVHDVFSSDFFADYSYELILTKHGYAPHSLAIDKYLLAKVAVDSTISVELTPLRKSLAIVVETADGKRLAQANIELKSLTEGKAVIFDSGKEGVWKIDFDQQKEYELVVTKANFKKGMLRLTAEQLQALKDDAELTVVLLPVSMLFERNEIGQMIEMDIKYDLAKSAIRKDAAKELDRLADYMKKNPTVKVELGSHTDSRGSAASNHSLSQKRAASAAQYLTSKGISSQRIIPVGYGKDDLKIIDATTEEEHQQNRRTTVKIVGI